MGGFLRVWTSLLILTSSFTSLLAASVESPNCINCVTSEGKNCDKVFRRYAKSKYWLLKGDATQSYSGAQQSCVTYGKVIAQVRSGADMDVLRDLAQDAGYASYWAVNAGPDLGGATEPIVIDDKGQVQEGGSSGSHATVCQYPDGHPCLKVEPPTKNNSIESTDPKCPHPTFGDDNQFIRTGTNSKYLFPLVKIFGTWEWGKQACESSGLELASLETLKDHIHLSQWIENTKLNVPKEKSFLATVSAQIDGSTGEIKDSNTGNPISFQLYNLFQKSELQGSGCTALQTSGGLVYFAVASCENQNFMPLCQYKRDSACYQSTPLYAYELDEKDELIFLDTTNNRSLFGSTKQKPLEEAAAQCQQNGMKLLDFVKKDKLESVMIWGVLEKYETSIGYPTMIGKSWTSGVYPEGYSEGAPFAFLTSGETWSYKDSMKHFGVFGDDVTNPQTEKCLLVAGPQQLRPFSCSVPNYFVCYKDNNPSGSDSDQITLLDLNGTSFGNETETVPEEPEATPIKESKCKGEPVILSFDQNGLTNTEILDLIALSHNLNFDKGYSEVMKIKPETAWRIKHVVKMGHITKWVCPEPYVSLEFVNVLMNMIMVYYNSIPDLGRSPRSKLMWQNMIQRYDKCKKNTEPFSFTGVAGMITGIETTEAVSAITMPTELVDGDEFALDIILEGLWYMFEVTAAACFNIAKWKTTWLAEYFAAFRLDFTEQFKDWWIAPSVDNYGLLFGDIDLFANLYNLRYCAVAGFERLGIIDRLPVRPLNVNQTNFLERDMNKRVIMSTADFYEKETVNTPKEKRK